LEESLVERAFLLGRGEFGDFGEVEVLSRGEDVIADDPIGGHGIIEPDEMRFVGMAVVAGGFEDLFYFRRGLEVCGDGRVGEGGADELERENEDGDDDDSAK
jgi:hypothetical protein